jgi:putative SOS response-associated peptidase YedK
VWRNIADDNVETEPRLAGDGLRQQYSYWAKDGKIGLRTINAKAETITTAPAFREAIKYRRCLVPADAFYEWVRISDKVKQPFAIAMKDGQPYALAALWGSGRIGRLALNC